MNYTKKPQGSTIEWPTVGVAGVIYTAFALLTWFHEALHPIALALAGGYVVAWHGSLQHEVLHGHPTRSRWINELLVLPNLWLWMPYLRYRDTHISHHSLYSSLTDPHTDPESYYLTADEWRRMGPVEQLVMRVNHTLAGRILVGPVLTVGKYWRLELGQLLRGHREHLGAWAHHLLGCTLVGIWVIGICGMPWWVYVGLFAYPGLGLSLIRSYAEHQATTGSSLELNPANTVVVESRGPFSLLFLNNNLHAVHHAHPGVPWYELPQLWRSRRDEYLARPNAYYMPGYSWLFKRFAFRAKEPIVHPRWSSPHLSPVHDEGSDLTQALELTVGAVPNPLSYEASKTPSPQLAGIPAPATAGSRAKSPSSSL